MERSVHTINKRIALTLRSLRQEKGWSLDKTSQETGVSKAMLGQIEREESSPTISTLWKIATGFQTSFSSFIEETYLPSAKPVYRTGQTQPLHPNDKKIRVMPLFPFDNECRVEIFVIELLPGCEHLSPPHKKGVIEHVIVAEGNIEVFVNHRWQSVEKGEGLRFNANQPHGYRNTTSLLACFHNIIHHPTD